MFSLSALRTTLVKSGLINRRAIARILSTLLCCIVVAIRPFSTIGGQYAFLVITVKELIFAIQENLAQQLEGTALNVMGALLAIGISTVAKCLANLPGVDPVTARTIPAVSLVFISFVAGWVKSRLPRLQQSMRICCFVSIWLLTVNVGKNPAYWKDSLSFVWITLSPAVITLIVSLFILEWSSAAFGEDIVHTLDIIQKCLACKLRLMLEDDTPPFEVFHAENLDKELLRKSVALDSVYEQAAFEIRLGRLDVTSLKPFIKTVEHLRRELAWGMSIHRASLSLIHPETFKQLAGPTRFLGESILQEMELIRSIVSLAYQGGIKPHDFRAEKSAIVEAESRLRQAKGDVRQELERILETLGPECSQPPQDVSDLSLAMVSLLQMGTEVQRALQVCTRMIALYESSAYRVWHPRVSLAWLGLPPRSLMFDEQEAVPVEYQPHETNLTIEETREGVEEYKSLIPDEDEKSIGGSTLKKVARANPATVIRRIWRSERVLQIRLQLSRWERAIHHSPHLRHAFKNAAGVALLSLPVFLSPTSSGHKWFESARGQWMVISYVWVLETSTGATWRTGYLRLSGTIIGAIYAYLCWLIARTNPYGLTTLITIADVPVTWIILETTVQPLGVVINVTLGPIAFAEYVQREVDVSVLWLATLRGLMIMAGIVSAIIVNHTFYPRHCRILFLTGTCRTLSLLNQLYLTMGRDLYQHGTQISHTPTSKRPILKLEIRCRNSLHQLSLVSKAMNDELSWVPKPTRKYQEAVFLMQRLLDIMTGLRKVRENVPKEIAIVNVLSERRDMISCVCVGLFACENAFRGRQPIPQFLPSARSALNKLELKVRHALYESQKDTLMNLSPAYALVEGEIMKAMVVTLEAMTELCRSLFGSDEWAVPSHGGTRLNSPVVSRQPSMDVIGGSWFG